MMVGWLFNTHYYFVFFSTLITAYHVCDVWGGRCPPDPGNHANFSLTQEHNYSSGIERTLHSDVSRVSQTLTTAITGPGWVSTTTRLDPTQPLLSPICLGDVSSNNPPFSLYYRQCSQEQSCSQTPPYIRRSELPDSIQPGISYINNATPPYLYPLLSCVPLDERQGPSWAPDDQPYIPLRAIEALSLSQQRQKTSKPGLQKTQKSRRTAGKKAHKKKK
jgi:hypothetical protein